MSSINCPINAKENQIIYVTECQYVNCKNIDNNSAPDFAAFDSKEKAIQKINLTLEYVKNEFLEYYKENEVVIVYNWTYVEIHDVDYMDWWCGKIHKTELK